MDPNLKKTLRAITLEIRHILEGYFNGRGEWQPGDLERRLAAIGIRKDRPPAPAAGLSHLAPEDKEARRVVEMTLDLARAMGVPDDELIHIRRGALLHDIGKMGIPDAILHKTGALNEKEWEIMRQHPTFAYEMLYPISYLRLALNIPYCHHERWDGTGYPRGLKGEQIPLAARIFAVVDVWDAITSDRPYRKAWTREAAIEYLQENAGKHFDPQVVEMFLRMLKED